MAQFRVLMVGCLLVLAGCVTQERIWVKIGSTQQEFNQDRYACLQQSQQSSSRATIGQYGGYAASGMITNDTLFSACMSARGWTLSEKTASGSIPYKEALAAINDDAKRICANEELAPIMKKVPCVAHEVTLSQLSDKSKLNASEKTALSKWRVEAAELNKRTAAVHRQYNLTIGDALAAHLERSSAAQEKLALDLFEGRISLGDFNKKRQELFKQTVNEMQKIAQSDS